MLCVKKGSQARSRAAVDPQAAWEQLSRTNTDTAEMQRQLFKVVSMHFYLNSL